MPPPTLRAPTGGFLLAKTLNKAASHAQLPSIATDPASPLPVSPTKKALLRAQSTNETALNRTLDLLEAAMHRTTPAAFTHVDQSPSSQAQILALQERLAIAEARLAATEARAAAVPALTERLAATESRLAAIESIHHKQMSSLEARLLAVEASANGVLHPPQRSQPQPQPATPQPPQPQPPPLPFAVADQESPMQLEVQPNIKQADDAPTREPTMRRRSRTRSMLPLPAAPAVAKPAAPAVEKQYAAFVSHAKADAAMEARFVQSELEKQTDLPVFLDSDDLRDLSELMDHVRASEVLLLLQSANVLTRPYCLLEICAAIDAGVPVVGVNLASGHRSAYDFSHATQLCKHIDTHLPKLNPGAESVLNENGLSLIDVAHKLSALPQAISVPFNPSASRNILAATMHDVVEAMRAANPPKIGPFDAWRNTRGASTATATLSHQPAAQATVTPAHTESSTIEADPMPLASGGTGGGGGLHANGGALSLAAGAGLLEMARAFDRAQPVGYLLQAVCRAAVAVGAGGSHVLAADCMRFALCCELSEQVLLQAENLADKPSLLQTFADIFDDAARHLALMGAPKALVDVLNGADYLPGALAALAVRLHAALAQLRLPADADRGALIGRVSFPRTARIDELVRSCRAAATPVDAATLDAANLAANEFDRSDEADSESDDEWTQARAELQRRRQAASSSASAPEMVVARNQLLEERVGEMQQLFREQSLMMQAFMKRFPLPADELERRAAVDNSKLMTLPLPCPSLDAALAAVTERGSLGIECKGLFIGVLDATTQRNVAFRLYEETGRRWVDTAEITEGMPTDALPRKMTYCQYVLAAGEVVCVNPKKELLLTQKHGVGAGRGAASILQGEPAMLGALSQADSAFAEGLSALAPCMDPAWLEAHPGPAIMFAAMNDVSNIYVGAPLRIQGRVVGTLCALLKGEGLSEASVAHRQALEGEAKRVTEVLKELSHSLA